MEKSKRLLIFAGFIATGLVLGFQNCSKETLPPSTIKPSSTTCTNPFGCGPAIPSPTQGQNPSPTQGQTPSPTQGQTPVSTIPLGSPCQLTLATFDNPNFTSGPNFNLVTTQLFFMTVACPQNAANLLAQFGGANGSNPINTAWGRLNGSATLTFIGNLNIPGSYARFVTILDANSNPIASMTSNTVNITGSIQSKSILWRMTNSIDITTAGLVPSNPNINQTWWQWNYYYNNVLVPLMPSGTTPVPINESAEPPPNKNAMNVNDWCAWQASHPVGSGAFNCSQSF